MKKELSVNPQQQRQERERKNEKGKRGATVDWRIPRPEPQLAIRQCGGWTCAQSSRQRAAPGKVDRPIRLLVGVFLKR